MPKLLDLFCGAGGASAGYAEAGYDVTGVDIAPQPNYPFEFHQADALTFPLDGFDVIHASPPCQGYTTMNNRHGSSTPRLIKPVRLRLSSAGVPYVIENVVGARRDMLSPLLLAGRMFGLGVHRPRLFESNQLLMAPGKVPQIRDAAAIYGKNDGRRIWTRADGTELRVASLERARDAMGIDWMTWDELKEAIPPAYTRFIGEQITADVRVTA
jgi:DNA (cytosine-5)-methyltransferase 1